MLGGITCRGLEGVPVCLEVGCTGRVCVDHLPMQHTAWKWWTLCKQTSSTYSSSPQQWSTCAAYGRWHRMCCTSKQQANNHRFVAHWMRLCKDACSRHITTTMCVYVRVCVCSCAIQLASHNHSSTLIFLYHHHHHPGKASAPPRLCCLPHTAPFILAQAHAPGSTAWPWHPCTTAGGWEAYHTAATQCLHPCGGLSCSTLGYTYSSNT